jgi:hypothetical protein
MALTKLEHFKDEPSCKWRAKELVKSGGVVS